MNSVRNSSEPFQPDPGLRSPGGLRWRFKAASHWFSRVPWWTLPLLVSLLFFQIRGVNTSPDSAWYMVRALNLYQGQGDLESDRSLSTGRGPVFPGLIALSFGLFGVSTKSALGVVRFFFVLNTGLVYAAGARFFSRGVGLVAAFLVLTSFAIHEWSSYILLDNVVPFFILLCQLLVFLAFEEKRRLYFGLAGLTLGLAFLTKEVAILFFPLPILLWLGVPAYRRKNTWRDLLVFYSPALLLPGAWFLHSYGVTHGNDPTTGRILKVLGLLLAPADYNQTGPGFNLSQWVSSLGVWIVDYYRQHFAANFTLAPLFLLAWGYILFRAILKRSHPEILLVISFVLFLPVIPFLGRVDWRAGQSFYLFLISYLALARGLWAVSDFARSRVGFISAAGLSLLVIAVQVWFGPTAFIHLLNGFNSVGIVQPDLDREFYTLSLGSAQWHIGGWHTEATREAGQWFNDHARLGEPVLISDQWANSIYFFANARQPVYHMSYIDSREGNSAGEEQEGAFEDDAARMILSDDDTSLAPILFIWPHSGGTDPTVIPLLALSEPVLLSQIETLGIKYVVVTERDNFITLYLRANPAFEEVKQFGGGKIKIFKVKVSPAPVSFPTHIDPRTILYMRRAAQEAPALYERLVADYFERKLGISRAQVKEIMATGNIGRLVEVGHIY